MDECGCGYRRATSEILVVMDRTILPLDCTSISSLGVILYQSFARCYHWWKLDKVHVDISWDLSILLMTIHKTISRASLVAQWLRIRLPMQGTRVRGLVWEDPTCCGTTNPLHHNY